MRPLDEHTPGLVVGAVFGALFMAALVQCSPRWQPRAADAEPRTRARAALEACAVECRDVEIGMRLARVDLRHGEADNGFTCVCERSER